MSAQTHQLAVHFEALYEAVLVAPSNILDWTEAEFKDVLYQIGFANHKLGFYVGFTCLGRSGAISKSFGFAENSESRATAGTSS